MSNPSTPSVHRVRIDELDIIRRPLLSPLAGSYGMYVVHFALIAALGGAAAAFGSTQFARESFSTTVAVPVLTVLVASASWRYLERPLLARSRRRPQADHEVVEEFTERAPAAVAVGVPA